MAKVRKEQIKQETLSPESMLKNCDVILGGKSIIVFGKLNLFPIVWILGRNSGVIDLLLMSRFLKWYKKKKEQN